MKLMHRFEVEVELIGIHRLKQGLGGNPAIAPNLTGTWG